MTFEITLTLAILLAATALFVSERLRVDLIALLVLGSLALSGLVTPVEALSGFSNPAVVTVWAVFVLSGGLSRTGIASIISRQVLKFAGKSEARLLALIMLTAGGMSAFMNNVGVAALLLPVVMDIARSTRRPPSRLLMPLASGCLLGGLTTMIGTPPNILVSDALSDFGLEPFGLFDYTPVGLAVLLVGTAYMVLIGKRLLPARDLQEEFRGGARFAPGQVFDMQERLFSLIVPPGSVLAGKSLAESRLGSALDLNVIAVVHKGRPLLAPDPDTLLQAGDKLVVAGRLDRFNELRGRQSLVVQEENLSLESLVSTGEELVEVRLATDSPLVGQTLKQAGFRRRYGVNVLAILRNGTPRRTHLQDLTLQVEDRLLVQTTPDRVAALRQSPDILVSEALESQVYRLQERLFAVGVPEHSVLVGKTLVESRLGDLFGLTVVGILRNSDTRIFPGPEEKIQAGDTLLIEGKLEDAVLLRGLQDLELDAVGKPDLQALKSEQVGMIETVLSPYTTLAGKTLRDLHFREKYGVNVLAIWRESRAYRSNLGEIALRFGDTLLLYGPREKLKVLGSEPDFLVLAEDVQEAVRLEKAPLALLVMAGVLVPVMLGWLPIAIAAVVGAALMVLTGCLNMEEAYRYIEWRAVFLIAGMLPLGIALEKSGAARLIAERVVEFVGNAGPMALLASLFVLTSLAAQFIPTSVVAVLMSPIALNTAADMGVSPYALAMAVAMAASASFLSPVAHPANVLVMGPGGYRFSDYTKVGLPLTLVVFLVILLVLPVFWPL